MNMTRDQARFDKKYTTETVEDTHETVTTFHFGKRGGLNLK